MLSVCVHSVTSVTSDSATSWTTVHQAPLSMGLLWREYWSGLPFLPLGDILDPGIEPASPVSPALAGEFFTTTHFIFYSITTGVRYQLLGSPLRLISRT